MLDLFFGIKPDFPENSLKKPVQAAVVRKHVAIKIRFLLLRFPVGFLYGIHAIFPFIA